MKSRESIEKFRKMKREELEKELKKLYEDARKLRLEIEGKKSDKTSELSKKRLLIAQILTVINSST